MRGQQRPAAFTLIELLVVVTVTVVLLALLAPALDQAIYQTELVRCATQQKAVAGGAFQYAMDHKRWYMDRTVNRGNAFPYGLKAPVAFAVAAGETAQDDRPIHKGYVQMDWLMDPLAQKVDLGLDQGPTNEAIYSNYLLYYGFGYSTVPPSQAMQKIGDRWEFADWKGKARNQAVPYKFQWLVADLDIIWQGRHATAGHPDKAGVLSPEFAQGGRFNYGGSDAQQQAQDEGYNAAIPVTFSFWRNVGNFQRGRLDMNFAAEDGSVLRLSDVKYEYDERIAHVPNQRGNTEGAGNAYPGRWLNIAKP